MTFAELKVGDWFQAKHNVVYVVMKALQDTGNDFNACEVLTGWPEFFSPKEQVAPVVALKALVATFADVQKRDETNYAHARLDFIRAGAALTASPSTNSDTDRRTPD